jgi:hypothetical protein
MRAKAPGETRTLKRLAYVVLAFVVIWGLVGYLATIPVVGSHPDWRKLRARPEDFGLKAEDVSFSSRDGILLRGGSSPRKAWLAER